MGCWRTSCWFASGEELLLLRLDVLLQLLALTVELLLLEFELLLVMLLELVHLVLEDGCTCLLLSQLLLQDVLLLVRVLSSGGGGRRHARLHRPPGPGNQPALHPCIALHHHVLHHHRLLVLRLLLRLLLRQLLLLPLQVSLLLLELLPLQVSLLLPQIRWLVQAVLHEVLEVVLHLLLPLMLLLELLEALKCLLVLRVQQLELEVLLVEVTLWQAERLLELLESRLSDVPPLGIPIDGCLLPLHGEELRHGLGRDESEAGGRVHVFRVRGLRHGGDLSAGLLDVAEDQASGGQLCQ